MAFCSMSMGFGPSDHYSASSFTSRVASSSSFVSKSPKKVVAARSVLFQWR
jgi:hypothetical protein